MNRLYRLLLIILSVATGALFIYSAYTKLAPIQSFEYTISGFTHVPLILAKVAARLFVGLEAGLGLLIALHTWGHARWVLKAATGLTVLFSAFLVFLWVTAGNHVNCGCFGDALFVTPSMSLLKNAGILGALFVLHRWHCGFTRTWVLFTAPVVVVATLVTPFIIWPVYEVFKLDLRPLYTDDRQLAPTIDLLHGKHIVAFLNPTCGHCRKAAIVMRQLKEKDPAIPFFMVLGGTHLDITPFWEETHAQNIPNTRLNRDRFLKITGGIYPQIFWVNNGWVEEQTSYPELDLLLIEKWMK